MVATIDESNRPAVGAFNPERFGKLESDVEYIKRDVAELKDQVKELRAEARTDFRWLLGLLLALAGMMAKGFHWIG
jgi:hypothetical protein